MISRYHYTGINLKHLLIVYIVLLIFIILLTLFCKYRHKLEFNKIENIEDKIKQNKGINFKNMSNLEICTSLKDENKYMKIYSINNGFVECSICLERILKISHNTNLNNASKHSIEVLDLDKPLVTLNQNCNHIFHKDCLEEWISNLNNSSHYNSVDCPICRCNIVSYTNINDDILGLKDNKIAI